MGSSAMSVGEEETLSTILTSQVQEVAPLFLALLLWWSLVNLIGFIYLGPYRVVSERIGTGEDGWIKRDDAPLSRNVPP